jgi:site-specific DNA recombinase
VGIWIRVSTEDQARGESPEHHEHRARAYAEAKGWRVREVYHLEAVSGKSVMGQPETERMLSDIRSGRISALIFSKLARLARNTKELLEFADIFRECDADLISLQESIDTSSPAGRLFYTLIAAMAQWEREEIAERVAASVPIRAKLGKPIGGAAPFGYRWENRQLVPDEKEAPIRKLMYELFLEHKRKKTVARLLNERGFRTRTGAKFSDTTIDRLLRDPIAKGVRRANYTKSLGEKKHWKLKPEDEWVLTSVRPIVDESLWVQVNAILDEGRSKNTRKAKKVTHLFAGVAICHCGQKMYVPSDSPKYVCYQCRNKIAVDDLEAVFHEQLRSFYFSPDEVAKYVDQFDEEVQKREDSLESLEAERSRVAREMEKVYKAFVADEVSSEAFGRLYRPLEERLSQIEKELPRLQGEADFMRIQSGAREEILGGAKDLFSHWPDLAPEEKREIVEAIVEKVVIGKNDVVIELFYSPPIPEVRTS